MTKPYIIFTLFLASFFIGCDSTGGIEEYNIDFEDETFGDLEIIAGDWRISEISGRKAAEAYGSANTAQLLYNVNLGADFTQTIRFYIESMSQQTAPSMAFSSSGQVVNLLIGSGVIKLSNGDPSNPDAQANYTLSSGHWYTLEVNVSNGSRFSIRMDGIEILTHSYSSSKSYKASYYWTYPIISTIYIDDISIITE